MQEAIENQLSALFEQWAGEKTSLILPLAPSGSARVYYRLQSATKSAIGTYNPDDKENTAFVAFSKHFHQKGLPVPEIYAENLQEKIYLQEDLGATTLYSFLLQKDDGFPDHLINLYKKAVTELARIQIEGAKGLDYKLCYPRAAFDRQSILWDLNTFKYYFLKLGNIIFDEQALENDFHTFADYLLQADTDYFLFRDFQSRNIMIREGEPVFIDYQGGRRGALQYDLASLLFQAKANIPHDIRNELLEHYLEAVGKHIPIDKKAFTDFYYAYVLVRCIQVFGTYGFRGLYERKQHFLESIPFAINNIKWFLANVKLPIEIPELWSALQKITTAPAFQNFDKSKGEKSDLTIKVKSFSYKYGIPADVSGNGGGFVFDCRFLHNPGRYEPYKQLTGRDESVINFLKQKSNMNDFVHHVLPIVEEAVENYIDRNFASLMINFGCTGGQHRSVYAADQIAQHLKKKYGVAIELEHRERGWTIEYL